MKTILFLLFFFVGFVNFQSHAQKLFVSAEVSFRTAPLELIFGDGESKLPVSELMQLNYSIGAAYRTKKNWQFELKSYFQFRDFDAEYKSVKEYSDSGSGGYESKSTNYNRSANVNYGIIGVQLQTLKLFEISDGKLLGFGICAMAGTPLYEKEKNHLYTITYKSHTYISGGPTAGHYYYNSVKEDRSVFNAYVLPKVETTFSIPFVYLFEYKRISTKFSFGMGVYSRYYSEDNAFDQLPYQESTHSFAFDLGIGISYRIGKKNPASIETGL